MKMWIVKPATEEQIQKAAEQAKRDSERLASKLLCKKCGCLRIELMEHAGAWTMYACPNCEEDLVSRVRHKSANEKR